MSWKGVCMPPRVADIVDALFELAPESLAESWDNVGLLVGDGGADASRVVVALDVTDQVLRLAAQHSAQLVVAHHPVLFRPLKRVRVAEALGALIAHALRRRLSVCAMHTNLDVAPGGLSDRLAELVGLTETRPLAPVGGGDCVKLVVFTPPEALDAVRAAICQAGGGHIGNYADCSFRSPGVGSYRPQEGARPYAGSVGQLETAAEERLEVLVPRHAIASAVSAMRSAHPYEEVAYDIYPLENPSPGAGLGRVGRLPAPVTMTELANRVRDLLAADRVKVAGDRTRSARTVAVCPGSGGDLVEAAARAGAEVLVTGDVKYHQALAAAESGLVVIDAGHGPTERPAVALMAEFLADRFGDAVQVITAPADDVWAVI
jgi:dinuclear metal center YbgI/SA1388 family protein